MAASQLIVFDSCIALGVTKTPRQENLIEMWHREYHLVSTMRLQQRRQVYAGEAKKHWK